MLKPEKIICLGDTVGYNADPDLCLEELFTRSDSIIRGNHEKAVSGLVSIDYFNEVAKEVIFWTRRKLKRKNLTRIKQMAKGPLLVNEKFLICHGSPVDEDLYIIYESAARESFQYMHDHYPDIRICFFGHTHVPLVIEEGGEAYPPPRVFSSDDKHCYLINPGSVGQPRDGIPLASFGLYDDEKGTFEHFRIPYPVEKTQKKILSAGLPLFLAERLSLGK